MSLATREKDVFPFLAIQMEWNKSHSGIRETDGMEPFRSGKSIRMYHGGNHVSEGDSRGLCLAEFIFITNVL